MCVQIIDSIKEAIEILESATDPDDLGIRVQQVIAALGTKVKEIGNTPVRQIREGVGMEEEYWQIYALLKEAVDLLGRLEFSVGTFEKTGSDTYECPECGGSQIRGLTGHHDEDCLLQKFLSKPEITNL